MRGIIKPEEMIIEPQQKNKLIDSSILKRRSPASHRGALDRDCRDLGHTVHCESVERRWGWRGIERKYVDNKINSRSHIFLILFLRRRFSPPVSLLYVYLYSFLLYTTYICIPLIAYIRIYICILFMDRRCSGRAWRAETSCRGFKAFKTSFWWWAKSGLGGLAIYSIITEYIATSCQWDILSVEKNNQWHSKHMLMKGFPIYMKNRVKCIFWKV